MLGWDFTGRDIVFKLGSEWSSIWTYLLSPPNSVCPHETSEEDHRRNLSNGFCLFIIVNLVGSYCVLINEWFKRKVKEVKLTVDNATITTRNVSLLNGCKGKVVLRRVVGNRRGTHSNLCLPSRYFSGRVREMFPCDLSVLPSLSTWEYYMAHEWFLVACGGTGSSFWTPLNKVTDHLKLSEECHSCYRYPIDDLKVGWELLSVTTRDLWVILVLFYPLLHIPILITFCIIEPKTMVSMNLGRSDCSTWLEFLCLFFPKEFWSLVEGPLYVSMTHISYTVRDIVHDRGGNYLKYEHPVSVISCFYLCQIPFTTFHLFVPGPFVDGLSSISPSPETHYKSHSRSEIYPSWCPSRFPFLLTDRSVLLLFLFKGLHPFSNHSTSFSSSHTDPDSLLLSPALFRSVTGLTLLVMFGDPLELK